MSQSNPEKIKVLLVRVKKEPELVEVDATVEVFQDLVAGPGKRVDLEWLEVDGVFIICDELGKQKKLPANRWINWRGLEDILVGDFFMCGRDVNREASLNDEQVLRWTKKFMLSQSEA